MNTYINDCSQPLFNKMKTSSQTCLNIGAMESKGMNMSFVGMIICTNGIVAFGDSKASRMYSDGHLEIDTKRGSVPKIFANDTFIFVTHGCNEMFSLHRMENIENYIQSKLEPTITYEEFFRRFYHDLRYDLPEYHSGIYTFIIGSLDEMGYYIRTLCIDILHDRYDLSKKDYRKICYTGGDSRYVKMFEHIPTYYDIPLDDDREILGKQVEKIIEIYDLDKQYNPVGLPVMTRVFKGKS